MTDWMSHATVTPDDEIERMRADLSGRGTMHPARGWHIDAADLIATVDDLRARLATAVRERDEARERLARVRGAYEWIATLVDGGSDG